MHPIQELKYRWKYNRASLPGELYPTKYGASIIYCTKCEEVEKNAFLRKVRGVVLGYGNCWTFKDAFDSWLGLKDYVEWLKELLVWL